jgi:thiamine biosynthesis lipoprotein
VTTADHAFAAMGTTCRVVLTGPDAEAAARAAEARVVGLAAALTRFEPGSALSILNADPRPVVPAGVEVRAFVRAAVWAGRATGGLVDPTLLSELEASGYLVSRAAGEAWEPVTAPLADAPARRPARARAVAWWEGVVVDDEAGTVSRPPGLRFDAGGIAKGLIADQVLWHERARPLAFVDCGGDIAVGGAEADLRPWSVAVRHPLLDTVAHRFRLARGGIATSGMARRVWRRADGSVAHHLLDPATGEPAWTGLLSATALGASALEAEALAKAAYLGGPEGARRVLAAHGGLLVLEDGTVEVVRT